jgi:short-subunit dehydrogenase
LSETLIFPKQLLMIQTSERIAILGASRGLGLALSQRFLTEASTSALWLGARRASSFTLPPERQAQMSRVACYDLDFTKEGALLQWQEQMSIFQPTRLIYCAGGGPFGKFADKPWHSHLWALNLNLIFPAQLLHEVLTAKTAASATLKQLIFIGSAIAENSPDPLAASYASGKHGLRGLLSSVKSENSADRIDLRFYSPGYMDTPLLPPHSRPRQDGSWIADPAKIADDLVAWALTPPESSEWHRVLLNKDQLK